MKFKTKEDKGITLIALVITVIVLLILAGVAIAALTGENGILNQAGNAKEKTQETEAVERVALEVQGSYGTDGNIDKDQLNKNLENIAGLKIGNNDFGGDNIVKNLPVTVTLNGYVIEINSNGEVAQIPEIIAKIIENPKEYYGKKVTNYKDDGNTYRIFYIDTENYFGDGVNTIYLKADYSGSVSCSTSYDNNQTLVKQMNPLWAEQRGDSESSWNTNEKASAWLCDPSKWTTYCDSEKANYAIGGPSVEMYVKSYNQAYNGITDINVYTLGATYRETNSPGYIYTLNGDRSTISNDDYYTGTNSLDHTKYNSMYCGQNEMKTGYWWLSSPSASISYSVCCVSGEYTRLNRNSYNNSYDYSCGVSPLVSLKSSFMPEIEE